jgi:hypothetical protein
VLLEADVLLKMYLLQAGLTPYHSTPVQSVHLTLRFLEQHDVAFAWMRGCRSGREPQCGSICFG